MSWVAKEQMLPFVWRMMGKSIKDASLMLLIRIYLKSMIDNAPTSVSNLLVNHK